jgi:hypothetical protein
MASTPVIGMHAVKALGAPRGSLLRSRSLRNPLQRTVRFRRTSTSGGTRSMDVLVTPGNRADREALRSAQSRS